MSGTHVIGRVVVDLTLRGSERDGMRVLGPVTDLCRTSVTGELARVLDRIAPAHGHLRIERLDIDAGVIPLAQLDSALVTSVASAVEAALNERLPAGAADASADADGVTWRSDAAAVLEAFVHVLEHGVLPWTVRDTGQGFSERVLAALRSGHADGGVIRIIDHTLRPALRSARVRLRLALQYSPELHAAILAQLSPDTAAAMRILDAACAPAMDTDAGRRVARALWDAAWTVAAERAQGTPGGILAAAIRRGSLPRAHLAALQETALRALLDAASPGASGVVDGVAGGMQQGRRPVHDGTRERALPASALHPLNPVHPVDTRALLVDALLLHADTGIVTPARLMETPWRGASSEREDVATTPASASPGSSVHGSVAEHAAVPDPRGAGITGSHSPGHDDASTLTDPISVDTAGLVLLHPFLPQLLRALGIARAETIDRGERALAVLHYLATGTELPPEHALALAKVLCGIAVETPVGRCEALTALDIDEADALLAAVIGHWSALKDTSVDGLRGGFLVRPGLLSPRGGGDWLLRVEPRGYDMLLHQLPWGFSMVRLPWMSGMLHVEWEY